MSLIAWESRWPHFKPEEVLSPRARIEEVCPFALDLLENLRQVSGVRLLVNHGEHRLRGVRTEDENRTLPHPASGSFHVKGRAFDVTPLDGLSIGELVELVTRLQTFTGVGVYPTWLHLDTRYVPNGAPEIWVGKP